MKTIKVVMLEPGKEAYITEINSSLNAMQEIVGGLIEAYYPFNEAVCFVCNEEGKLNGFPLNRAIYDSEGTMIEVIAGTAFLCDCRGDNFGSLSEEQLKRYCQQYQNPELFLFVDGKLTAIPVPPEARTKD